MDLTLKTFGRLDVLVNDAAYPRGNDRVPLPDLHEAVWQKVLDIKLAGAFLLCKPAPEFGRHHAPGRPVRSCNS